MRPSSIRLICFDLGGVIIRTCESWTEACRAAGLPPYPEVESAAFQDRIRAVDDRHQLGAYSWDEFCQAMAEAAGGLYRPDEIARIHDAWLLGEYPGMDELVQTLNDSGRALTTCLSNTNQRHWDLMEMDHGPSRFPAFHRLRARYGSHQFGLIKPDSAVYRETERRTGVEPARILFFDDTPENVEAARACGWEAEWVDRKRDTSAQIRRALEARAILEERSR